MSSYSFIINGQKYQTKIKHTSPGKRVVEVNGVDYEVEIEGEKELMESRKSAVRKTSSSSTATMQSSGTTSIKAGANDLLSPIPGLILDVMVKEGESVSAGQIVLKMEAMKMENEIKANKSGKIGKIHVNKGDSVLEGQPLLSID